MPTNPITQETSLKNRPGLRWTLISVWIAVVVYCGAVLGTAIAPQISAALGTNISQTILGIPALLQLGFDYGVDFLLVLGFSLIR